MWDHWAARPLALVLSAGPALVCRHVPRVPGGACRLLLPLTVAQHPGHTRSRAQRICALFQNIRGGVLPQGGLVTLGCCAHGGACGPTGRLRVAEGNRAERRPTAHQGR